MLCASLSIKLEEDLLVVIMLIEQKDDGMQSLLAVGEMSGLLFLNELTAFALS